MINTLVQFKKYKCIVSVSFKEIVQSVAVGK